MALIVTVVVDAFVDGFLIGITCSLSHHAGLACPHSSLPVSINSPLPTIPPGSALLKRQL